ncbi:hypothetical protein [Aquimarina sp. 2201CG14-23]|uniref:hypothetical protein n=1 Tax=Aquimarina mycalae TaxID=3040073 RepID=UPI002477E3FF|nr:hypothetical protein [Aquimarina sp. 2201CG14-23]MDH7444869.1 hypothetical protein [Aquimarina sp. 2201CG14-23]
MFQEDLQNKVKGSISEKSFYSYFKNDSEKLPRIDILHLLSEYCGYKNWNDFKASNTEKISQKKNPFAIKWIGIVLIGILCISSAYFFIPKAHAFTFCFIDQDRNQPIIKTPIDIIILNNKQSPFYAKSDSLGCFSWKTKDDFIHFVIKSPYHKTDTIFRTVSSITNEPIQVSTNDYALMLHYYANGNIEDWKNRKNELTRMIAKDAIIFQVLPSGLGIEVYSKNEFINKLTTPTNSLKNIEIIESKRHKEQIVKLKFRVKS